MAGKSGKKTKAAIQGDDQHLNFGDLPDSEDSASDEFADSLLSLQTLIERHANKLDKLSQDLKTQRESLRNIFANDEPLSEVQEQAQELSSKVKELKQSLDNKPEARELKFKIGELNEQKKEIEETLNSHLINYYRMTGSNSFDTSDGDQREFVISARVKPKRK